jgi:hypothetical protein
MSFNSLPACHQCGGLPMDGKSCREKFEDALALEFGDPVIFSAVHHITVICYNIQHPYDFSEEALEWMKSTLRSIIVDELTGADVREQARKKYNGGIKVKSKASSDKMNAKMNWSMTIMDVRTDNAEVYTKDIKTWAKSILNYIHKNA